MKQKPFSHLEISELCRSLAMLLHGGLSLADGMHLLAQEVSPRESILRSMTETLDRGGSLSQAFFQTGCFPDTISAMADIAEKTGRQEEALIHLADYYYRRHHTARVLRSALTYPLMTLGLMLVVVAVLLIRVLPIFAEVYRSLGTTLTGIAAVFLNLGSLLQKSLPLLLAGGLALLLVCIIVDIVPRFREKAAALLQNQLGNLPLFQSFEKARFAQGLAMAMASGMPPEEAVSLAARLLETESGAQKADTCVHKIVHGADLAQVLAEAALLDISSCRMLALGLGCGTGDTVMEQIATVQMDRAEEDLESAIGKIEPVLVLFASVLVGLILLSVMLPLMDILCVLG